MATLAEKRDALELTHRIPTWEVGIDTCCWHSEASLADSLTKFTSEPIGLFMKAHTWALVSQPAIAGPHLRIIPVQVCWRRQRRTLEK